MKKTIIKTIALCTIGLSLVGCGPKFTSDHLLISKDGIIEQNKKVKVYYNDFTKSILDESNKNLADYLNSVDIIPVVHSTITNPNETDIDKPFLKLTKPTFDKKITGGVFKIDKNGIFYDKKYNSVAEKGAESREILSFLEKIFENKENKDKFNSSFINSYSVQEDGSQIKEIYFQTKFYSIFKAASSDIKKQIELGGWQMVDSPEKADKEIYVELSRDYFPKELDELKRNKKSIRFHSLEAGNKFNIFDHSVVGGSTSIAQSSMNYASASNGSMSSAAIGLGAGMLFSLLGPSPVEYSGSFLAIRVIDKTKKTDKIKLYDEFLKYYDIDKKFHLMTKIDNTINKDPDSDKFDINKK